MQVNFAEIPKTMKTPFLMKKAKNCPPAAPVGDHEGREKGLIVYPVYSRRSGGLSVGVNLFPDKKSCIFDCPYCEVFPFSPGTARRQNALSPGQMEEDLRDAIATALERKIPVKDICFSGNGEPTMSPYFPEALERAGRVRTELVNAAELVLITNGTGLLDERLFSLLRSAALGMLCPPGLNIWLKLDAGTPQWYKKMNRCDIPFEKIVEKIEKFASCAPVTLQTMICAVDGEAPPPEEADAWEKLVLKLAVAAAAESALSPAGLSLRKVQIYGKARPSPEDPKATALPLEYLEKRGLSLRAAAAAEAGVLLGPAPKVEVYP